MEAKGHVALEQPSSALRGGAGWQWRTAPASASACSTRLSRWPPPTIAGGIRPSPLNVFRHRSRSLSVPLYLVKTPLVKLDCREVFVAVHFALSFISPLVHGCPCCTSSDRFAAFCFSLSFFFYFLLFHFCQPCLVLTWREMDQALMNCFLCSTIFFSFCLCVFLVHVGSLQASCPLHRCCVMYPTSLRRASWILANMSKNRGKKRLSDK